MKKLAFSIAIVAALSGCTTVDDFRKMSPGERANEVCSNAAQIKNAQRLLDQANQMKAKIQANISRGYALHRQCVDQVVPDYSSGSCGPSYGWGGGISCSSQVYTKTVTTCHDVPVPINVYAEQQKLDELTSSADHLRSTLQEKFIDCHGKVISMTPEEAYSFYDNNTLP